MLAVDVVNACLKAVNACRKAGPIELKGNVSLNQLLLSEVLSDYFVKASSASSFFAEKKFTDFEMTVQGIPTERERSVQLTSSLS
jgi:hypothetical protein